LTEVSVRLAGGPHRHVDRPHLALGTERSIRPTLVSPFRRAVQDRFSGFADPLTYPSRYTYGDRVTDQPPPAVLCGSLALSFRSVHPRGKALHLLGIVDRGYNYPMAGLACRPPDTRRDGMPTVDPPFSVGTAS